MNSFFRAGFPAYRSFEMAQRVHRVDVARIGLIRDVNTVTTVHSARDERGTMIKFDGSDERLPAASAEPFLSLQDERFNQHRDSSPLGPLHFHSPFPHLMLLPIIIASGIMIRSQITSMDISVPIKEGENEKKNRQKQIFLLLFLQGVLSRQSLGFLL
jgi:hypothetical protein